MTDEELRVEVDALRASADTWFPEMVTTTLEAVGITRLGAEQMRKAFAEMQDLANGLAWWSLMNDFADAIHRSAARLGIAAELLRHAASSYEDADEDAALQIEAKSR